MVLKVRQILISNIIQVLISVFILPDYIELHCTHHFFSPAGLLPVVTYFAFPQLNGTYLYLIMCRICLFIVITNNTMKYRSSIGQKTGTSNNSKKVMNVAIIIAREQEYQNLNSGNLRANGLYRSRNNNQFKIIQNASKLLPELFLFSRR